MERLLKSHPCKSRTHWFLYSLLSDSYMAYDMRPATHPLFARAYYVGTTLLEYIDTSPGSAVPLYWSHLVLLSMYTHVCDLRAI